MKKIPKKKIETKEESENNERMEERESLEILHTINYPDDVHKHKKTNRELFFTVQTEDDKKTQLKLKYIWRYKESFFRNILLGYDVNNFLESMSIKTEEPMIPLPMIESKVIIDKVFEYIIHHYKNPGFELKPPLTKELDTIITKWDSKYLKHITNNNYLIRVLMAAHFLNINNLYSLLCAKICELLKKKDKKDIKILLGEEYKNINDFSKIHINGDRFELDMISLFSENPLRSTHRKDKYNKFLIPIDKKIDDKKK